MAAIKHKLKIYCDLKGSFGTRGAKPRTENLHSELE